MSYFSEVFSVAWHLLAGDNLVCLGELLSAGCGAFPAPNSTGLKIALATARFHDFGVALPRPWNTWVNMLDRAQERTGWSRAYE